MTEQIVLSGVNGGEYGKTLRQFLSRTRPRAVGVAVAFASIEGVKRLQGILRRCGEPECRLIAGIDSEITHPEALYAARDYGWGVRIGRAHHGIFHPKLVVAGRSFARDGSVRGLCSVYVGSSNLTKGGLKSNVECGFVAEIDGDMPSAAKAFRTLWNVSLPATKAALRRYAERFAKRAHRRGASELADLEVCDIAPDLSKTKGSAFPEAFAATGISGGFRSRRVGRPSVVHGRIPLPGRVSEDRGPGSQSDSPITHSSRWTVGRVSLMTPLPGRCSTDSTRTTACPD